jgi:cell wall-associated NlpC family hydrolase
MWKMKRWLIKSSKNIRKLMLYIIFSLLFGYALANLAWGDRLYPKSYIGPIIEDAEKCIGRLYEFGANGDYEFDCSGYVEWLFRRAGISIPRNSRAQARYRRGEDVYRISDLQRGDLIFFEGNSGVINHVGMVCCFT